MLGQTIALFSEGTSRFFEVINNTQTLKLIEMKIDTKELFFRNNFSKIYDGIISITMHMKYSSSILSQISQSSFI